MMKISSPIVRKIKDDEESLNKFALEIASSKDKKEKRLINDYPTVYIHVWKNKESYEAYVGESSNIFRRTKEHYYNSEEKENWQYNIKTNQSDLYIIGHEHFNKSLTLDIENKLRNYLTGVETIKKIHNIKKNPQNQYYTADELESIFHRIWKKLREYNNTIFPLESKVEDSALFKASPLHKLTISQQNAKELILSKITETLLNDKRGQLIFIEGEAGTGKTVLNSSTFYELCYLNEVSTKEETIAKNKKLKCCLLVNHKEQAIVYRQIFKKLCTNESDGIVYSPTSFINQYTIDDPIDVAFVDEAHLLLTQGRQSYKGKNQLQDIMDRAKVTIIMFDMNQILSTEQYWEYKIIEKYKENAKENDTYLVLREQLRMHANKNVIKWIDDFTKEGVINQIPKDIGNYDIKIFDTPELLEKAIKQKFERANSKLSRLIATYDWKYSSLHRNNGKYWEVIIGNWHKPWNYEMERDFTKEQKKEIKSLSWSEQSHTIDEVGSTFTIQGFDLNYAGLIIGPSVKFKNNKIVFDPNCSCNNKAIRNRILSDGTYKKFGEQLLKNELRVLMTRGVNGLYIYACDEELRKRLKKIAKKRYIYK